MFSENTATNRFAVWLPRIVASIATLVTTLAAVWDGIVALPAGSATRYSPTVALTAATVIGLIWYTYYTREALNHARQTAKDSVDTQRKKLATAVLAELRALAPRLLALHERGPVSGTAEFFSHPIVQLAASNTTVLSIETIQALSELSRRLNDIREFLNCYAALKHATTSTTVSAAAVEAATQERAELAQLVRFRAGWTYNSLARLVPYLIGEGGQAPAGPIETPVSQLSAIELAADPFPN